VRISILRMSKWPEEFRRGWLGLSRPPPVLVVAFAAFCLAGATLVRWGLSHLRADTPFSLYFPAVLFVTVFGGPRAGTATAIGGGILGFTLDFGESPGEPARLTLAAIYLLVCGLIIWGIEHYRSIIAHHGEISARLIEEEKYRKLIVEELQHRLRNKVATIHAVIHQALHDQPEAWRKIDGRIRALSTTDDLIAKADEKGCDIKDLLLSELGPYGHVRFTLNGEPLFLPAKLAVCLALMFHELATNAAKYGAFSSSKGVLNVSWNVVLDELTIIWDETEGPLVGSVGKTGFGTRLLNSALMAFDGRTELLFLETGFHCVIRCRIPREQASRP
jgi:two-component sensor histidine kinase